MANYPSFTQKIGSKAEPKSGIQIDIASNGDVRGQILHSADRKIFYVEHFLSASEKSTLDTFYSTNKALEISFTWAGDSQSYNCIFMDAPRYVPCGASRYKVSVVLVQKDT